MNLIIIKYLLKVVFIVFGIQTVFVLCDKPVCQGNHEVNKQFIFISTLDGKLTALNTANGGTEAWKLSTEPGALLSSTIGQPELSNNGLWVRMIPSLSGSLYTFDGENLDRLPFTVDSLLKSYFPYYDGLAMSGGKISRTYGVDMSTGQLLYKCDMDQCNNFPSNSFTSIDGNILILQTQRQTVRASDTLTGIERWNFSVGLHDIKVIMDLNNNCHTTNPSIKLDFKINIPNGVVTAVAFDRPQEVVWTHKSESPIVNVWKFEHGKVESIDLFKPDHNLNSIDPVIYLGMHKKQLYIQENDKVFSVNPISYLQSLLLEGNEINKSRIPWKPIPVSSQLISKSPSALQTTDDVSKTTAIAVLYASEYINGNGFYLNGPQKTKRLIDGKKYKSFNSENENETENNHESIIQYEEGLEMPVEIIIVSLWYWWKEVLFISVITAILINIFIPSRLARIITFIHNRSKKNEGVEKIVEPIENNIDCCKDSGVELSLDNIVQKQIHPIVEFKSRYLQDFEPIHCLGKGGFGIVFEARNKIDDCHYAIKRIPLPSKEESRNRVLREVKALAKLDHQHIVRYFNTWLEEPPSGWQEKHDDDWLPKSSDMDTNSNLTMSEKQVTNVCQNKHHVRAKSLSTWITLPGSSEELSDILNNPHALRSYNDKSDSSFIVFESQISDTNTKDCILDISSDNLTKASKRRRYKSECDTTSNVHSERKTTRHYLYIQMQLCHKNSLREWLKDNTKHRDMKYILNIFSQIIQAVEYVHLQGLIHRDLKPSNIFFSLDGQIKIGDFGLVTEMIESGEGITIHENKKKWLNEQHTDRVGTQLYMSPEQISGTSYNYKVDIYSLGVIFFELLNPFTTEMERYQTLTQLRNNIFPSHFLKKFKKEYDLLCLMLSPDPTLRPTAFDIRAILPLSFPDSNLDPTITDITYEFELHNRKVVL
ncbi:eukaryotic translation initiation factor 2-alpha kinase isoform X1 [Metopolophium dirhodum]|uniref:eukaryotic translation initiation factor 2-alpha kinase isoform X1 n=2 Tax=Metopolophium dirhodum TaxID=44670 RepID=UPI00298F849A|nr:eukaryotic translation initiation factor 2-alpha kinase isoform X1 [Metopolophium dirhodum]